MRASVIGIMGALTLAGAPAGAAPLQLELNKLQPGPAGCEAFLVARNGTDAAFSTLRLDLVTFDGDGVIGRRLAVEVGPLGAGRTVVRAFVVEGLACEAIGRMLLNGVLACEDGTGPRDDCAGLIAAASRAAAPLSY